MPPVLCERCHVFPRRLGKACLLCGFKLLRLAAALCVIGGAAQAQMISQFTAEPGLAALPSDAVITLSQNCPLPGGLPGNCRTSVQQLINTAGSTQYAPLANPTFPGSLTVTGQATFNGGLSYSGTLALTTVTVSGLGTFNAGLTVAGGTTTVGNLTAIGTVSLAAPTTTGVTGLLSDIGASSGAPTQIAGLWVNPTNWTTHGSLSQDTGLLIGYGSGNTTVFDYGIRFGNGGTWPLASNGSLISIFFPGGGVARGIDFTWGVFGDTLLKTPPSWNNRSGPGDDILFGVDEGATDGTNVNYLDFVPNATTVAPALKSLGSDTNISLNLVPKGTGVIQVGGTAGVTCSGTPTSSFAATKGIVTHC